MEIDRNHDEGGVPVRGESIKPSGGIYSLPVVGNAFSGARQFYDEMAPKEADSTEVRVAKEAFRWSSAVAGRLLLRWSCCEPLHSARKASTSRCVTTGKLGSRMR